MGKLLASAFRFNEINWPIKYERSWLHSSYGEQDPGYWVQCRLTVHQCRCNVSAGESAPHSGCLRRSAECKSHTAPLTVLYAGHVIWWVCPVIDVKILKAILFVVNIMLVKNGIQMVNKHKMSTLSILRKCKSQL